MTAGNVRNRLDALERVFAPDPPLSDEERRARLDALAGYGGSDPDVLARRDAAARLFGRVRERLEREARHGQH